MLRRASLGTWLKLLLPVAVIGAAAVALRTTRLGELLDQDRLVAWLEAMRAYPAAPLILLGLYLVLSLIGAPISPLLLAGGAVFGTWLGAGLSFAGLLLGASATYVVARFLGYDLAVQLLGARHRRLQRFLGRRGFWALVRIRYVPMPFVIVNFGAALAGVTYPRFAASTAVAFLPWTIIWSYFSASLAGMGSGERAAMIRNLVVAAVLMMMLTFLPTRWQAWQRSKRYQRLLEERRQRGS